jgi:succinate dehydrogenase hydrophobic anchor subunit
MTVFYVLIIILACVLVFSCGVLLAILLYNYNASFRRWINQWADNVNQHNHES